MIIQQHGVIDPFAAIQSAITNYEKQLNTLEMNGNLY